MDVTNRRIRNAGIPFIKVTQEHVVLDREGLYPRLSFLPGGNVIPPNEQLEVLKQHAYRDAEKLH